MDTVNAVRTENVIEIEKGNESVVLIDDIYKKGTFFSSVYYKAADLLCGMCLNDVKQVRCGVSDDGGEPETNNIIIFCAERGGGKSSALRSFANALNKLGESSEEKKSFDFPNELNRWEDVKNTCFFSVLNVIDPSFICEKEPLMRIILSRMFLKIRDLWDETRAKRGSYDDVFANKEQVDIIKRFKKCYKLLEVIYRDSEKFDSDDDLYDLSILGDSSRLKIEFGELVDCYLKMFASDSRCKKDKGYLVIQIDDTDLNTKGAYQIIEDIRKYCTLPNVIVLMALDMEQIIKVVEQHFVCDFKTLIDVEKNVKTELKALRSNDCLNMAVKYIDKIMPAGQQIHLPRIDDCIKNEAIRLSVKYIDTKDGSDLLEYKEKPVVGFQERLLRLIYNKTGIILVRPDRYVHNFLPKTLRELCHFLSYMVSLPDVEKITNISDETADNFSKIIRRIDNLKAFEQYFIQNWCSSNLLRSHYRAIKSLAEASPAQKVVTARKWVGEIGEIDNFEKYKSPNSYAGLLNMQEDILYHSRTDHNHSETYRFVYAMRFYFTLFFTTMELQGILSYKEGGILLKMHDETLSKVHYDLWDSSTLADAANSELCCFDIDYNRLREFEKSLDIDNSKIMSQDYTEQLKKTCLIKIGDVNHPLDINDPTVRHALKQITEGSEKKDSIKLNFDICYSLLYCMAGENNLDLRLSLFSYDVLHSFGKLIHFLSDNRYNLADQWNNFFSALPDYLIKLGYIPIDPQKEQGPLSKKFFSLLLYANGKLIGKFLEEALDNMKKGFNNIEFTKGDLSFDKSSKLLIIIRDYMDLFEVPAKKSSYMKENLYDKLDSIKTKIYKLNEYLEKDDKSTLSNEEEKELDSLVQDIHLPFEEVKECINDDSNIQKIISEL